MKWRTHRAGALSILIVISFILFVLGIKSVDVTGLLAIIICAFLIWYFSTLPDRLETKEQHRTWAHSVIPLFPILLFIYLIEPFTAKLLHGTFKSVSINYLNIAFSALRFSILIGWGSHLLFDSLTDSGIPIFYPIDKKRHLLYKIGTYRNDENEQSLLSICVYFICFLILLSSLLLSLKITQICNAFFKI